MRGLRGSGITGVGNKLSSFYGKLTRLWIEVNLPGLPFVLLLPKVCLKRRGKIVEMGIDRRISAGMVDVQRMAITASLNTNSGYVAFGCCINRMILPGL